MRYNAESALDALLDDLQEFRAESARPAAPSASEHAHEISCFCPRICLVSMLPHAPEAASVPVCHGYGHVALELVSREPDHQVPPAAQAKSTCACYRKQSVVATYIKPVREVLAGLSHSRVPRCHARPALMCMATAPIAASASTCSLQAAAS